MSAAVSPVTGWADDRLMAVYDAIYAVLEGLHPESDGYAKLIQAADLIETADVDMEKGR